MTHRVISPSSIGKRERHRGISSARDPSWVAPNLHIWCAEKLPWVDIPEGVTQAPANPS
jgi:hypothetical protein